MKPLFILILLFILSSCKQSEAAPQHSVSHPRLIINQAELSAYKAHLQENRQAILEFTTDIIPKANVPSSTKFGIFVKNYQIVLQAWTAEYLLGDRNRLKLISDTLAVWDQWIDSLDNEKGKGWGYYVLPGSAFMVSLITLDLIWNDLSATEQNRLYNIFQKVANWYNVTNDPHALNRHGIEIAWAVFNQDSTALFTAAQKYRDFLDYEAAAGGVHSGATAYAWYRLSADRHSKSLGIPLLQFHNYDKDRDSDIPSLYKFLFCATTTPFNKVIPFGDSGPGSNPKPTAISWFAASLDPQIQACISQKQLDVNSKDILLDALFKYKYQKSNATKSAKAPQAMIFGGGYAYLGSHASQEIVAALWNPLRKEWHAHPEHNGLYLGGKESHLLMGSGYAGAKKSADQFSWKDIHENPRFGNVLLPLADTTQDGTALPQTMAILLPELQFAQSAVHFPSINAIHKRSILRIPSNASEESYILVIDNLQADSSLEKLPSNIELASYWHAYSDQKPVQNKNLWYWQIANKNKSLLFMQQFPTAIQSEQFPSIVAQENKNHLQRTALKFTQKWNHKPIITIFSVDANTSNWKCVYTHLLKCQTAQSSFTLESLSQNSLEYTWILTLRKRNQNTPIVLTVQQNQAELKSNGKQFTTWKIPATPVNNTRSLHWFAKSYSDIDHENCFTNPDSLAPFSCN